MFPLIFPHSLVAPDVDFDIPFQTVFPVVVPVLGQAVFFNNFQYLVIGVKLLTVLLSVVHRLAERRH